MQSGDCRDSFWDTDTEKVLSQHLKFQSVDRSNVTLDCWAQLSLSVLRSWSVAVTCPEYGRVKRRNIDAKRVQLIHTLEWAFSRKHDWFWPEESLTAKFWGPYVSGEAIYPIPFIYNIYLMCVRIRSACSVYIINRNRSGLTLQIMFNNYLLSDR